MIMYIENYLRAYRRRTGLSEAQVGVLLGLGSGSMIGRYECGACVPTLGVVFCYELALGAPAHELFYGLFERARQGTRARADLLLAGIARGTPGPFTGQRIDVLRKILSEYK